MMKVELAPPEEGFDASVKAGVRCGKLAMLLLIADIALTLASMTIISFVNDNMSYSIVKAVQSIVGPGEILAAAVFLAVIALFMGSGVLAVKGSRGHLTALQAVCLSTASAAITGSMACSVIAIDVVILSLLKMPQAGYETMFASLRPDLLLNTLMWLPAVVLLAIVAGLAYAGFNMKIKKLY